MSKSVKKVGKGVKKVVTKSIKIFDPGMDMLLGVSAKEEAAKQARKQNQIAEQQAQQQAANTAEQARGAAMQMQTDADRNLILAEQQDLARQQAESAPEVQIAPVASTNIANRRKRFTTPQVGGASGDGTSIRL